MGDALGAADLVLRPGDLDRLAGVLSGQLSANTARAYRQDLAAFVAWVEGLGEAVLLDRDLARRYRAHLVATYAPATVNRRLTTLRVLCAELVERGELARNPLHRLKGFALPNESPLPALTRPEVLQLLAGAREDPTPRGSRDYAMLLLALWTGLRKSELLGLREADLGTEQGVHVARYVGKRGVRRRTKLLPPILAALRRWQADLGRCQGHAPEGAEPLWRQVLGPRAPTGPTWPWRVRARRLSDSGFDALLRRRCAAAGVPALTPHSLRATFVTLALEAGAPLHLVQYGAGHADSRTTERYDQQRGSLAHHVADYLGFLGAGEAETT